MAASRIALGISIEISSEKKKKKNNNGMAAAGNESRQSI